jgi:maspardin
MAFSKYWQLYDCGPREQTCPLVCLPPVSGAADVYYLQCLALAAKGYRVIAVSNVNYFDYLRNQGSTPFLIRQVESPSYWTVSEWCEGFKHLLTHLDLVRKAPVVAFFQRM